MLDIFTQLCGGIGLFLIGMTLMTDSLKELAGETLRLWLTKFTGSPTKALFSGIGLTLIVQSSTATTLATIGFVSAGVLTFSQAIGVVIGANIGTTSTGWMVAFLGVKFSIAQFALPLIAIGALLKLLVKGKVALLGLSLAGFGLIFFGIDVLQVAMSGFAERVDLTKFSDGNFTMSLLLVLIGIMMTVLLQSSSAAVTATLAALASGAIDLSQALGLVIGQNIGTVATAVLAAMGSTISAKRTASVHVLFNVIAAIMAFFILKPLFLWLYEADSWVSKWDTVVVVAAFHTIFSVLGALCIMPFLDKFEALIVRLIPDHSASILSKLNDTNLSVPAVAIQAATEVVHYTLFEILSIFKKAIIDAQLPASTRLQSIDEVISAVQHYLEKISINENQQEQDRLMAVLRLMVYLKVLRSDLVQIQHSVDIRTQPDIYQIALDYGQILENNLQDLSAFDVKSDMQNLSLELTHLKKWAKEERPQIREHVLEFASVHQLNAAKSVELFAAQRWLDRLIAHTLRLSNVLYEHAKKV